MAAGRIRRAAAMLALTGLAFAAWAVENEGPGGEAQKLGYSIGYQVGGDLARQGLKVDTEMVIRGLMDALSGSEPLMTEEERSRALIKLQREAAAAADPPADAVDPPAPDPESDRPDPD